MNELSLKATIKCFRIPESRVRYRHPAYTRAILEWALLSKPATSLPARSEVWGENALRGDEVA